MPVAAIDLLSRFMLESPWPTVVVLAVLAAVLHVAGQRRADRRLLAAGPALLAAGVGVVALAYAVDTPRERVAEATRQLVAATEPFDPATFDTLVDPRAQLLGPDLAVWLELPRVRAQLDRWAVGSDTKHKILGLTVDPPEATADGRLTARALLDLRTTGPTTAGVPVFTTWDLTWRRDAEGRWTATSFRWVRFNQQPPPRNLVPS